MTVPILILGAGRMGGALIEGWTRTGAFQPSDLILRDPAPGPAALAAQAAGARLNPPDAVLAEAATVLRLEGVAPSVKHRKEALAALAKRVKDAFDPKGVLNPGRMAAGV